MVAKRIVVLLLLASLANTQASTSAGDTTEYLWPVDFEDPVSDQTGPTPANGVTTPNDGNPESDIRRVQMTDDGTTVIVKITMGTCKFGVPSGFAMVIFELSAGGKDLEMTAKYKDGCTGVEPFESDSVLGDADAKIAGLRAEAVPSENAIYLMSDFSANGLVAGDVMAFDRIHTGRQFTDPGRYTFGLDEASAASYTVGSGAALMTPAAPEAQSFERDVTDGTTLSFSNATSDSYNFNATEQNYSVTLDLVAGSANVTLDGTSTAYTQSATIAWVAGQGLNVTFDAFVGNLSFAAVVAEAPVDGNEATPTPATEGAAGGADNGTDDGGPLGNGTADAGKESPSVALPLVLAMVATLAILRRRD